MAAQPPPLPPAPPKNHVYQFSLLNALMAGAVEQGTTVSQLIQQGNQGLGTFARCCGELVLLDGTVYQLLADGSVRQADPDQSIPFAQATQFEAETTIENVDLPSLTSLDEVLDRAVPAHRADNLFVSYRITGGRYPSLRVRSIAGQEYPGQPLLELHRTQRVFDLTDQTGVLVGFRSPASFQGFAVAGQHLHFLSDKKDAGGHVLDLCAQGVTVQLAVAHRVHIDLPTSDEFNRARLTTSEEDIRTVEGSG